MNFWIISILLLFNSLLSSANETARNYLFYVKDTPFSAEEAHLICRINSYRLSQSSEVIQYIQNGVLDHLLREDCLYSFGFDPFTGGESQYVHELSYLKPFYKSPQCTMGSSGPSAEYFHDELDPISLSARYAVVCLPLHHQPDSKVLQETEQGIYPFEDCQTESPTSQLSLHERIPYFMSPMELLAAYAETNPVQPQDDLVQSSQPPLKPYCCTFPGCKQSFTRQDVASRHYLGHTMEETYHCNHPGCGRSFRWNYQLVHHYRTHTKPYSCQEPGCHKAFASKVSLDRHQRTCHLDE